MTDFSLFNTMIWVVLLLFNSLIIMIFVLEFNKIINKANTNCFLKILYNLNEM